MQPKFNIGETVKTKDMTWKITYIGDDGREPVYRLKDTESDAELTGVSESMLQESTIKL